MARAAAAKQSPAAARDTTAAGAQASPPAPPALVPCTEIYEKHFGKELSVAELEACRSSETAAAAAIDTAASWSPSELRKHAAIMLAPRASPSAGASFSAVAKLQHYGAPRGNCVSVFVCG